VRVAVLGNAAHGGARRTHTVGPRPGEPHSDTRR
jgi:hypothetical protein